MVILKDFNGKSYKDATAEEIKKALKAAHNSDTYLMKKFYSLFKGENGLLSRAKTCNSAFGFISTILLVPGLIIWLTDFCEKMTERKLKEDKKNLAPKQRTSSVPSNSPTMAGFIGASAK